MVAPRLGSPHEIAPTRGAQDDAVVVRRRTDVLEGLGPFAIAHAVDAPKASDRAAHVPRIGQRLFAFDRKANALEGN